MKKSGHFNEDVSRRPDREEITDEWRERALHDPEYVERQRDGRTRRWTYIAERGKWLRVVVLADGETVHTNFWDRGFERKLTKWEEGGEWKKLESAETDES